MGNGQFMPDGSPSPMIARSQASGGGGVYPDVTGENEIYGEVHDGIDEASGIAFDIDAVGPVVIVVSHTEILDDQLVLHHGMGVYDLNNIHFSSGDISFSVLAGDIRVGRISTPYSVLLSASRDIFAADGEPGISAGAALFTARDIGTGLLPMQTTMGTLAARATNSVHVRNAGPLTIGTTSGIAGIVAGGDAVIDTSSGLTAQADILANGSIILDAPDTADDSDFRLRHAGRRGSHWVDRDNYGDNTVARTLIEASKTPPPNQRDTSHDGNSRTRPSRPTHASCVPAMARASPTGRSTTGEDSTLPVAITGGLAFPCPPSSASTSSYSCSIFTRLPPVTVVRTSTTSS